jgi:carbon storage regulator
MLVLSRKLKEKVLLPDIQASVEVVSIEGNVVRLGIQAPAEVAIVRAELRGPAAGAPAAAR